MSAPPIHRPVALVLAVAAALLFASSIVLAEAPAAPPFQGKARWIAAEPDRPTAASQNPQAASTSLPQPLPIFRRSFTPRAKVVAATLFLSGLGQFEAHINGRNVTDAVLTPGWSDYRKRIYYDTYNVTSLIASGENVLGILLGNGMYNVEPPANRYTKFRGSFGQPKLIAELRLRLADGSEQVIVSDGAWKTNPGPITFSDTYGGEDYEARREQPGWDAPHFDDHSWSAVTPVESPGGKLVAEFIPPVKAFDRYEPIQTTHPKPNLTVYDLGQNMAGWPEIEVTGPAGSSVKLIAGELLDPNGLVTQHSANAGPRNPNLFTYTLKGGAAESWHPRFSYYGFRYVQVETAAATPDSPLPTVAHIDGRFLHDAVAIDGHFTSSSDLLNRIHTLIDRAILSNAVSVLTDCPHREKLGWLEQTHLAGASLMYNYSLGSLYAKIAADMRDAQLPDGLVPDIAPEFTVFGAAFRDSPEWGAAAILSPWTAYQFYGDRTLLRDQYPAMQHYAAYLHGKAKDHILAYGLGDWYDIGPKNPGISQLTSSGVTSTAIYYQSLTSLARIATLLGHPADAAAYTSEATEVKQAFNAHFFHAETSQYDTGSQTANAMPLVVGLAPEASRAAVLDNLVADIRAHTNHVTAGDVGFHYVVRALTDGGRSDVLFDMLMRTDKPSYGDQLARGATTLTEAWDTNPNSSQNHFMLGHAEEWFYRGLAGIDIDLSREKLQQIRIHPAVPGDLTSASATYQSALGLISSAWVRTGDTLKLDITIPPGNLATIVIPADFSKLAALDARVSVAVGSSPVTLTVPPGTYHLEAHR